ncbi:MAG: ComEC/Rec2 family competence protein [Verrucomicrobiota bacterium]
MGIVLVFMSGILSAHIADGMILASWVPVAVCVCAGWLAFLVQCCVSRVREVASAASCFFIYSSVFFLGFAMDHGKESEACRESMVLISRRAETGDMVRIGGIVSSHPEMRRMENSGRLMSAFRFSPRRMVSGGRKWKLNGVLIRCNLFGLPGARNPRYGEYWEVSGKFKAFPPLSVHEIEFLEKGGITGHGMTLARLADRFHVSGDMESATLKSKSAGSGLKQRIYAARAAGSDLLGLGVDDFPLSVSITRALLLGYRSGVPSEVRSLFAETGTLHIFAISGLHVGIVAGIIIFLLSAAKVSRIHWFFVLAPCLGIYIVLTGANPSAIRAGIMALAYFGAYLAGRKGDVLSALALSALVILVIAPGQIMMPGFIFSFAVVAGLLAVYPFFHAAVRRNTEPDRLRLEAERWWQRMPRVWSGYVLSLAGLSVSAWLVSAPLTAIFFERVSPVALLGNLFVAPLTFLIVLTASLSVVCGSVAGSIGSIFNHANVAFTSLLLWIIGCIRNLPMATLKVARPSVWMVASWYLLLAVGVVYMRWRGISNINDQRGGKKKI